MRPFSKDEVHNILNYERVFSKMRDPPFDCPPPNFEVHDGGDGWLLMAKAIYLPKGKEKI